MSRTSINDSLLGSEYSASANILDNGGFEIWQRGTSFTNPANNAYTADRWYLSYSGSLTGTVSQNSSTIDSGKYSLDFNLTNASSITSSDVSIGQDLEVFTSGKQLYLSVRINSNISGITVSIQQNGVGSATSSSYSGSGWQTLSVAYTPTGTTVVSIYVNCPASVQTTYIDSAMLVIGTQPANFIPLPPMIDLARCQRYFQVIGGQVQQYTALGQAVNTTIAQCSYPLPVQMRVAPTFTANNQTNFSVFNAGGTPQTCTSISSVNQAVNTVDIQAVVSSGLTAGNAAMLYTLNASPVASIYLSADL